MEKPTEIVIDLVSVSGEKNGLNEPIRRLKQKRNDTCVVSELKKNSMLITHSKPTIGQEDIKRVAEVLASGRIAQGEEVRKFENSVANFVGAKYAVACSSGTSALHLALIGLGIKPGDEVLLPSYVCTSPFLVL